MQANESRQYFLYPLLLIKGICILSVILLHVTSEFVRMNQSGWLTITLAFANCLSRFAVPLFVMLSAFYLSLNPRNECAGSFYRRTLKFLVIPYFAYSLVYSIPTFLKNGDPLLIVPNLLTASAADHLWFGLLIIQLYLLHPFLSRWYRACKHRGVLLISAFSLQIASMSFSFALFRNPDLHTITGIAERLLSLLFVSNIGYFLAGYYLHEHSNDVIRLIRHKVSTYAGCVVWLATAVGLVVYWGIPMRQGANLRNHLVLSSLTPILSFAALTFIVPLFQNRNPDHTMSCRFLHSLGLYSHGVYYFHPLIFLLLRWTITHILSVGRDTASFYWLYLLLFLPATLMTLLSVRLMARLPLGRYVT